MMEIDQIIDSDTRPLPRLKHREVDGDLRKALEAAGLSSLQARVAASRIKGDSEDVVKKLQPDISDMDSAQLLVDMDVASQRLATAIITGEPIYLFFDYDQDGLGGGATAYILLTQRFNCTEDQVRWFVGHRLHDGYGLTDTIAKRIEHQHKGSAVLITIDAGSKDGERITRLDRLGIDVLVTDHHSIDQVPEHAYACINPQRSDCDYPDKFIAGGYVVWLLLSATDQVLRQAGHDINEHCAMTSVWDYVACSTVADCVSLTSLNNRAVVKHGLELINQNARPCWQAIRPLLGEGNVTAESIAFGIAPRVNATSRVSDPEAALKFLLASTTNQAKHWVSVIDDNNTTRKAIEAEMKVLAMDIAGDMVAKGCFGLPIFLNDGHPGVQGICASKVSDAYGRPSFIFSPSVLDKDLLTGSARSIECFDSHQALSRIESNHPTLFQKWGGHKAACGATIKREDFDLFAKAYEEAVRDQLDHSELGPVIASDGQLAPHEFSLKTVDDINHLAPYGREFESPVFDNVFRVMNVRPVGQDQIHAKVSLLIHGAKVDGIWFFMRDNERVPMPIMSGQIVHLAYRLEENVFRGKRSVQLKIINRVVTS